MHGLADVRREVSNPAQLDERRRQEPAQTDVDDEAALDDFDDRAGHDFVGFLLGFDVAPRTLVLGPLLRQQQTALFVLESEDEGLDLLSQRDDFGGVDVVADAQLAAEDDAFGLVADVQEHFVLVDLDHGAVDHLAVFDGDHGAVDRISERHTEIVGHDLAGGVGALFVEGSHLTGGRLGGGCGVGQGTNCFRNGWSEWKDASRCTTRPAMVSATSSIDFPDPAANSARTEIRQESFTFRTLGSGFRRLRRGGRPPGTPVTRSWGRRSRRHRARRC